MPPTHPLIAYSLCKKAQNSFKRLIEFPNYTNFANRREYKPDSDKCQYLFFTFYKKFSLMQIFLDK